MGTRYEPPVRSVFAKEAAVQFKRRLPGDSLLQLGDCNGAIVGMDTFKKVPPLHFRFCEAERFLPCWIYTQVASGVRANAHRVERVHENFVAFTLCQALLRQIGHQTDKPNDALSVLPERKRTAQETTVRAIRDPEPIFRGPGPQLSFHELTEQRKGALAVFGMNSIGPPIRIGHSLPHLESKKSACVFVPINLPRLEIVLPNQVPRRFFQVCKAPGGRPIVTVFGRISARCNAGARKISCHDFFDSWIHIVLSPAAAWSCNCSARVSFSIWRTAS